MGDSLREDQTTTQQQQQELVEEARQITEVAAALDAYEAIRSSVVTFVPLTPKVHSSTSGSNA